MLCNDAQSPRVLDHWQRQLLQQDGRQWLCTHVPITARRKTPIRVMSPVCTLHLAPSSSGDADRRDSPTPIVLVTRASRSSKCCQHNRVVDAVLYVPTSLHTVKFAASAPPRASREAATAVRPCQCGARTPSHFLRPVRPRWHALFRLLLSSFPLACKLLRHTLRCAASQTMWCTRHRNHSDHTSATSTCSPPTSQRFYKCIL